MKKSLLSIFFIILTTGIQAQDSLYLSLREIVTDELPVEQFITETRSMYNSEDFVSLNTTEKFYTLELLNHLTNNSHVELIDTITNIFYKYVSKESHSKSQDEIIQTVKSGSIENNDKLLLEINEYLKNYKDELYQVLMKMLFEMDLSHFDEENDFMSIRTGSFYSENYSIIRETNQQTEYYQNNEIEYRIKWLNDYRYTLSNNNKILEVRVLTITADDFKYITRNSDGIYSFQELSLHPIKK